MIDAKQDSNSHKMNFSIEQSSGPLSPRLGKLTMPGRATLQTPHYIANTSRGIVSHLTQDMMRDNTSIDGVYVALEDFMERASQQTPPVFSTPTPPNESPMRTFMALQNDALLVLGARRVPPVPCPKANTNSAISIYTSVGFTTLTSAHYAAAAQKLRPDIIVGLADLPRADHIGLKRIDKMTDRTTAWTQDMLKATTTIGTGTANPTPPFNIFVPILPVDAAQQSWYLTHLLDPEVRAHISGLALYAPHSLAAIPEALAPLPRLCLSEPPTPAALLREISLGADIFVIPFIGAATDAGIALSFAFPCAPGADTGAQPPSPSRSPSRPSAPARPKEPLGIDLWDPAYATALEPLVAGCACYACVKHHRAYVQHLLAAKEMLGWVLLQVHNHAVLERFFGAVRASVGRGTFEADREVFGRVYEEELPAKTGLGPRVRGYQYKASGPGEPKKNPSAYRMLDDRKEKLEDAIKPDGDADAKDLVEKGFAEIQT